MQVVRIRIKHFRCVRESEIFPLSHNVLLGPNNIGKTTLLEALNLVLNPEFTYRSRIIDENDFYQREYLGEQPGAPAVAQPGDVGNAEGMAARPEQPPPSIHIELVLANMDDKDIALFRNNLVPWQADPPQVVEETEEGKDPFEHARPAIRVVFEAWYNAEEDEFDFATYFLPAPGVPREECTPFTRDHKRQIGFLIYRDFRALTRPITLEPGSLFNTLLQSQDIQPKHFEEALARAANALSPMTQEPDLAGLLASYQKELERFMPLSAGDTSHLCFEITDRTRNQVKQVAQLYVGGASALPIQKLGAGGRSLALLAILTLIMRRRGRGILALEEPETFLFPHAQRRVIDEALSLASQSFITTHSPYVLERLPVEGVGRLSTVDNVLKWHSISIGNVKQINLYSKRLRQVHCEALMGRGVLVVEGDSDRWWLAGIATMLNGQVWNGRMQEALDLQGISVVSADTNGDILKLCNFFFDAGLRTVGLFDKIDDATMIANSCAAPYPCIFLKATGLERLLATELSPDLLRKMLVQSPHSLVPLQTAADVAALNDVDLRTQAEEFLIRNKGSGQLHRWIIEQLSPTSLPPSLCNIIDLLSQYIAANVPMGPCSMLSQ